MKRGLSTPAVVGIALGAWILAFTLAATLFRILPPDAAAAESPLGYLLHAGRAEMGAGLIRRADLYFHKGVSHTRAPGLAGDPFRRLLEIVAPESVVHIGGQNIREIMPWLRFATRIDPQQLDGFLIAAFWLSEEAHRTDVAHTVLLEALRGHPDAYILHLGRGKLFLRQKNFNAALQSFSAALRCWPRSPVNLKPEDLNMDRAEILTYRALVLEIIGRPAEAVRDLEAVLVLFPNRQAFRDRIEDLKAGRPSLMSAVQMSDTLLKTRPPDNAHPDADDEPDGHAGHAH